MPRFEAESPWAWRLARRFLASLPARGRAELFGLRPTVAHALETGTAPVVLVQADPEAYLVSLAAERLLALAGNEGVEAAVPVTNEPASEEARAAPPLPYHTPSLLEEAAGAVAAAAESPRSATPALASPVFAARREALARLPAELPLDEAVARLAAAGRVVVEPGAYLHRYGAMDGQAREDLARKIPPGSRSVLDVGCSGGATAALLRRM